MSACQKQHRQNDPAGQARPCGGGSRTDVETTDISQSVKTTQIE